MIKNMNLPELISDLSNEEKTELFRLLKSEFSSTPVLETVKSKLNKEQVTSCPHCKSIEIQGHGAYKARKRYICKSCNKTFNDFTGTAISGLKKPGKFQEYIELVAESITLRKASAKLELNIKTVFDWRHKILSSLSKINDLGFSGIVECDDKQLNMSEKGKRNLEREPYKRPSDRDTKRGVSNDKVSIMVASDRNGNVRMSVAKIGRIDIESVEKTIGDSISKENILCSDSHPSIISWAKGREIEHHTFVASKQHVKNKCYHVQHVNSIDNRYERWVKRFYGTATKYLDNYLNWFVFLEKIKKSLQPIDDFAKVIVSNIDAIAWNRSTVLRYENLKNPQFSTT